MHGLNTNPNLSFMHQLKLPAGYRFRNKRPAAPQRKKSAVRSRPPWVIRRCESSPQVDPPLPKYNNPKEIDEEEIRKTIQKITLA